MPGYPWSDEEKEYLEKRVSKDKIHPLDVWKEMQKKFTSNRSFYSIQAYVSTHRISYAGLIPKAQQKKAEEIKIKAKSVKARVADDTKETKLRQRLLDVGQKYKMLVREKTIGDRMIQVLRDEAKALPKVRFSWKQPSEKKTFETACLLLGDLHLGEEVDYEETHGLGEYNFDIFVKRLKFLSDSIKSITVRKLKGYQIDKLVVLAMGDMVSGLIHEELVENAESIILQVMNGAYVTAQFILELQQLFPEVEILGVLGNHGRIYKRKRFKRKYENWDYIFYQFLGTFLAANKQISCYFPKSPFLIKDIYGWGFLVLHGDNIISWMGIPWYGIQRAMWKLGDLLQGKDLKIHYRILGHFHNTGELDRTPGEIIINGSMIGGNEFSLGKMFEFGRPTQLFFGVHKEIGMTWRYPLRLDLAGVNEVKPYKYNRELDAGKYMQDMLERK